jgi:hypothetical protein
MLETCGSAGEGADAVSQYGCGFAESPAHDQAKLVQAVQDLGSGDWHGLNAGRPEQRPSAPLSGPKGTPIRRQHA